MIDLDPACLRAFLAVIESGGFTRAGMKLNRTQSAISMQIRRLEDTLGVKLIADRKKATLTPAGERILQYARRMVTLNDELVGRAKGADVAGRVRIGTPDDYVSYFLPHILRRLSISHPHVEVEVRCNMSSGLVPLVDRGILDLALITRTPGHDEGMAVRREPVLWAACDESVAKLRPLPLAMFSPGCRFRDAALAGLDRAKIPYRLAYESPSVATLCAAVFEGLAVTALARISLPPGIKVLDHTHGLPKLPDIEIALYGPCGIASPAAQAVKTTLLEALAAQPDQQAAA
jgi:DNA-binding transcriptional LysR family regulator